MGIKIPRIDRTGLDDLVLRCKVRSRLEFGSGTVYELQSAFGVVDRKYSAASLVPQDHVVFPELESLDMAQVEGVNSVVARNCATDGAGGKQQQFAKILYVQDTVQDKKV